MYDKSRKGRRRSSGDARKFIRLGWRIRSSGDLDRGQPLVVNQLIGHHHHHHTHPHSDNQQGSEMEVRDDGCTSGWVFIYGKNSMGAAFSHLRFLVVDGKNALVYKQDPKDSPDEEPITTGIVGTSVAFESLGRVIVEKRALYGFRIYNEMDKSKGGNFGCASSEEANMWENAFRRARKKSLEEEGPKEAPTQNNVLRKGSSNSCSSTNSSLQSVGSIEHKSPGFPDMIYKRLALSRVDSIDEGLYMLTGRDDAKEASDWRLFKTEQGLRFFEDSSPLHSGGNIIVKTVGVVDAPPEAIFDTIMSFNKSVRTQWDNVVEDMTLVDQIDGHNDIIHVTLQVKYFASRFKQKRDACLSRHWRREEDGTYLICTVSTVHADCRPKKGYRRLNMSLGVWEISPLPKRSGDPQVRSLVTQMMELKLPFLRRLRGTGLAKFYKTHTYLLLSRISGLREYFAACGNLCKEDRGPCKRKKKVEVDRPVVAGRNMREDDSREVIGFSEEFYDAMDTMAQQSATDDESESESINLSSSNARAKLRQSAWGLRFFLHISSKHKVDDSGSEQLLHGYSPVSFDPTHFKGSVPQARHAKETNCWDDPGGEQFVVRGKNYLQDCVKVRGERPLLSLVGVDWFKDTERMDNLASRPESIVQTPDGKSLPFMLVCNLQVPGPEHHSLVFYFASEKPIRPSSLLDRFISGDDTFRNERFKLIPRIVEGYWVVKRAVGTKAVLLGKAVTCSYYRQDNYLEIDVDIGSSSVARSIIGLVLGYVECLTVDMAIVIQGEEESELPEYILASMRIMHLKLDSATSPPPAR